MAPSTFTLTVLSAYAGYYGILLLYDRFSGGRASSRPTDSRVYSFPSHVQSHPPQKHGPASDSNHAGNPVTSEQTTDPEDFDSLNPDGDIIPDDGIEVTEGNLNDYFKRSGRF